MSLLRSSGDRGRGRGRTRSPGSSGRPLDDHAAVVHHRHPLGDVESDVHVVLDQDESDRAVETEQALPEQMTLSTRQARRRLVEHQHLRLRGQSHRYRHLTVLSVRERPDHVPESVVDRHPFRRLVRELADSPIPAWQNEWSETAVAHAEDGEVDGVLDGQPEEHAGLLVRPCKPKPRPHACGRRG